MTRDDLILAIRAEMDAEEHPRWTDARLVATLGAVHVAEWGLVLEGAPNLRQQTLTLLRDANGRVPLADLSSPSTGDARRMLYRVLDVEDGEARTFTIEDYGDAPSRARHGNGGTARRVRREGDYLQFTPVEALGVTITVNHTPTPAHLLSAGDVAVEWPDGYEYVLIYESAGVAMMKGGAETDASNALKGQAIYFREKMMQKLTRWHGGPRRLKHSDDASAWGSQ